MSSPHPPVTTPPLGPVRSRASLRPGPRLVGPTAVDRPVPVPADPLPPAAVTLVPATGRRVRLQVGPPRAAARWRPQRGQATAEYALVLLGAAAIALLLAAWAAKSGKIGQLFDAVVDQLIGRAG